uniref:Uncharacterized protein n=1 Tax=Timema shepardi TaxID=629360 RepID=A0A7R9AW19_TIMSH|nr:unnamed protein product [Timema shepardi]
MLTTPSNGQFGPEAPKEVAPATVFPSDVTLHRVQAGSTPFSVTSSMLLLQTQSLTLSNIVATPLNNRNNQSDFVRLCGFPTNSNLVTAVKGGRDAFSLVLKARHGRVRAR